MSAAIIFAQADGARSALVAETVAPRFLVETALCVPDLPVDQSFSVADLSDGIVRAHLLGAISMIVAARNRPEFNEGEREAIVGRAVRTWTALLEAALS